METIFEGKRVGMFGGCYCPPHAGHYNSLVDSIRKLALDIVIIEIYGKSDAIYSRHGVTNIFSEKVWNKWGETIKRKYNCTVIASSKLDYRIIPSNVSVVLDINIADTPKMAEIESKKELNYSPTYLPNVPRNKIQKVVLVRDDESGLSATSFTMCLIEAQKTMDARNCLKYVPTDLREEERLDYLLELLKMKLWKKLVIVDDDY